MVMLGPCFVYHKRVAEAHWWPRNTKVEKPRPSGEGPLCIRCGVALGTAQSELAYDRHKERTGHGIGTGWCVEECDPDMDKEWWVIEPW